jgi:glycosyltransferase involved in cell wall biosynthesis
MVKRKRLGIRFDFSYTTATGAAIFFQNIIRTLAILPDEKKPEVYVFVSPDAPVNDIRAIDYPYLNVLPIKYLPQWKRAINRIYRKLSAGPKFSFFTPKTFCGEPLDGVLSLVIPSEDIATKKQLIWIADLQIYHLPQHFTPEEIAINKALEVRTVKGRHDIVLCSQWVIDDFNKIFEGHHCKTHRLRFATIHPDYSRVEFEEVKKKYNITQPYFMVSNQFWVHKNHMAVLTAVNRLKTEFPDILCVISGNTKITNAKTRDYIEGIQHYIKDNTLDEQVRLLGLIPREEQLCLLKNCMAIIQPSFFESWNTTVEDAKLLRKFIILSDLEVHREQIRDNVYFFDPNKIDELVTCMTLFLKKEEGPFKEAKDYRENVKEFAGAVISLMD